MQGGTASESPCMFTGIPVDIHGLFLWHMKLTLIDITTLRAHERVNKRRVARVQKRLQKDHVVYRPILVDRDSLVILDGHHRVAALHAMGCKRVPAYLIRYGGTNVRVYLRRTSLLMGFIKRGVVEMAMQHRVFPSKTTRHVLAKKPHMQAVPLAALENL